ARNCKSGTHAGGHGPQCPPAPTLTNAEGIPSSTTTRPDLVIDETVKSGSDAGVVSEPPKTGCDDAQLRVRLGKITTIGGGATIYCIVNATDGVTSEAAITAKTKGMSDGETFS